MSVAKKLGYTRDHKLGDLMRYLRKRRTVRDQTAIAFINAYRVADMHLSDPYTARLYAGATARATELGLRMEPFWLHEPGRSQKRLSDILYHRGYQGVLISPLDPGAPPTTFDLQRFAAVATSYSSDFLGVAQVLTNRLQGLHLATSKLTERGFKRVGMVVDDNLDFRSRHMTTAYFSWFQAQRAKMDQVPVHRVKALERGAFLQWVKRTRPEVVLTAPIEPYRWLTEEGFRVPRDISYATLSTSSYHEPNLSGINERPADIGAVAVETLAGQLHLHEYGRQKLHRIIGLDGIWTIGKTCS